MDLALLGLAVIVGLSLLAFAWAWRRHQNDPKIRYYKVNRTVADIVCRSVKLLEEMDLINEKIRSAADRKAELHQAYKLVHPSTSYEADDCWNAYIEANAAYDALISERSTLIFEQGLLENDLKQARADRTKALGEMPSPWRPA